MIKFGINEYVKNIAYNIISILLLVCTFVACTLLTSNISEQLRYNKFFEPYINENSIVTPPMGYEYNVEKLGLVKVEKVLYNQEWNSHSNDLKDLSYCVVYDDYVMENLAPRLKKGKIVNDGSGEYINVLISENYSGVDVGDVIEIAVNPVDGYDIGRQIMIPVKVTGIFESGQKFFFGNGVRIYNNMSMKEILGTHNYEQMRNSMIIVPQKDMAKLPEPIVIECWRSFIKFKDDITEKERQENFNKIAEYDAKLHGVPLINAYPEMSEFVETQERETKDVFMTNIPMCIAITILILVCIICMISIRNANNMRYYATLHICGMPIRNAFVLSGVEMGINSILAIIVSVSIIKIQMSNKIFGEINCVLNPEQWAIIIGISAVIVISTMVSTLKTLKERSPMSVLRDTAY